MTSTFTLSFANTGSFTGPKVYCLGLFLPQLWWPLTAFLPPTFPALLQGTFGQVTSLFEDIISYPSILTLAAFLIFIFYYLNIQIITSIRVVDVTQEGLFSHTISELHIDKIEDATSSSNGLFGTIFNYGNVYVQTAGATDRFEFHNVPDPAGIEKLVLNLYEKNSNFAQDTTLNKDIAINTETNP